MATGFGNADGGSIVAAMIRSIHENRSYLSEIDGAIGDGDHGINMDKGFSIVEREIDGKSVSMSEGLRTLGRTLVMEIGGSMGPIYGSMFKAMARASKDAEIVDAPLLVVMLADALASVVEIGGARVGDKTIIDTLEPAARSASKAHSDGGDFATVIGAMSDAARAGMDSTKDMVAKIGRSARLGERSRGVLDAGATSCFLLLHSMGSAMGELAR